MPEPLFRTSGSTWLLPRNLFRIDKLILAANISHMGRTLRTQVALYLDDAQVKLLDKLAKKHGRTKQDLLREAVNTLLKEYQMFKLPERKA
jgi:predicted DNA-binding protein